MPTTVPADIRFKKSLGQNLLLDDNINRIMVDAAGLSKNDAVVEVGAGLGALTDRLITQAGRVLALEIDAAFMPHLEERFAGQDNLALFRADILNHDLDKLVADYLPGFDTLKMISNLPYYITTPILFHFWEEPTHFERLVVMVQEEVGLRMTAPVGAHNYGVLTLAAAYYGEVEIVHKVPASCFRPRPKVDSCIVRVRNRNESKYPGVDGEFLLRIIRTAFAKRRKTLRNTLAKGSPLGVDETKVLDTLSGLGIEPGRRPQTLSLDEFAAVAANLQRNPNGAA